MPEEVDLIKKLNELLYMDQIDRDLTLVKAILMHPETYKLFLQQLKDFYKAIHYTLPVAGRNLRYHDIPVYRSEDVKQNEFSLV